MRSLKSGLVYKLQLLFNCLPPLACACALCRVVYDIFDVNFAVDKVEALKRYKFSLAFENSNEEDYVTEKFFQSLVAGMNITSLARVTLCYDKGDRRQIHLFSIVAPFD